MRNNAYTIPESVASRYVLDSPDVQFAIPKNHGRTRRGDGIFEH
jgi:hypothetical protein